MQITELLAFTLQQKASDLHLTALNPPILRVSGTLKPLKTGAVAADDVKTMIYAIMTEDQRALFEAEKELDFAIAFGDSARFRVNAFTNTNGMAAVFRVIPTTILSLEQLGAPPIFSQFARLERGLVLVTGPTGSGKSTTLAAMIDYINHSSERHILTIEDPVEFVHKSDRSLVNHREVGAHTRSFARALKSALREDPDVILVGEMRDRETISLALTAAETGHLVMGTLHTSSAAKTVDRIIDVFPGDEKETVRAMLAGSLQAVISQLLLTKPEGGRIAAHEIMVGTPAVRALIRENKIPQIYSMIQVGSKFGMQTMQACIEGLVQAGKLDRSEGQRALSSAESEGSAEGAGGAKGAAPAAAPAAATPKSYQF